MNTRDHRRFHHAILQFIVASRLNGGNWGVAKRSGELFMSWNFGTRAGELQINNFDGRSYTTGAGGLTQPNPAINQFGGSLSQSFGTPIGAMTGQTTGSFVNNGEIAAGGVMGNWGVRSQNYRATGIYGGAMTPQ